MMIKRVELIEKIHRKIDQREEKALIDYQNSLKKEAVRRVDYVDSTSEAWVKFATTIRRRVRRGEPVTAADLPQEIRSDRYHNYINLFVPKVIKEEEFRPRTEVLRSLIMVLESSPDELVSTSALERMGAPMRDVLSP